MLLVLTVTTEQQWDPPTTIVNVRPAGQQHQRARERRPALATAAQHAAATFPSPPRSPPPPSGSTSPPPPTPPPPSPPPRSPPLAGRERGREGRRASYFGDRMPVEPCAYEREALPPTRLIGEKHALPTHLFAPAPEWLRPSGHEPPPRLRGAEPCGDEYVLSRVSHSVSSLPPPGSLP